ncbi:MAG: hypothetical protein N2200_03935 [Bacteroidia bacterium]|nr:hypothetical protein [Bacteroidia bacterium]
MIGQLQLANALLPLMYACWAYAQVVEIENADELGGVPERRILRGHVRLRQDTLTLLCQEAVLTSDGSFTASGGVQTIFGLSGQITAATLRYDPSVRRLTYEGDVLANFPPSQLRAPLLHYDRNTETAWYEKGGILRDTTGEIHSWNGSYDTRTDIATFSGQVHVFRGTTQAHADTLIYDTRRYYATFPVPVVIRDAQRKDTLTAEFMEWNRLTGEVFLKKRATYRDTSYILSASEVYFASEQDSAIGFCDVRFRDRRGQTFAWADTAVWKNESIHLHTNASILYISAKSETTFVQGEHLWTQGDSLYATGKAELISHLLRARSDTLWYDTLNHILRMHGHAWLTDSIIQLYADKVFLRLSGRKADSARVAGNAQFLSVADTFLGFFHQIVSDSAYAKWDTSGLLREISFIGKVQVVYYQSENTQWRGAHYARANKLYIQLDSLQKPAYVRLEEKPNGMVFPMKEVLSAPLWIKGVFWLPPDRQPKSPFR